MKERQNKENEERLVLAKVFPDKPQYCWDNVLGTEVQQTVMWQKVPADGMALLGVYKNIYLCIY